MDEQNLVKVGAKIAYDLRGKGDFGYENNDGFSLSELLLGELDIDISLAAAGNAMQQDGIGGTAVDGSDGAALCLVERVILCRWHAGKLLTTSAALFSDAAR